MSQQEFTAYMRYGDSDEWASNEVAYQGRYDSTGIEDLVGSTYCESTRCGMLYFEGLGDLAKSKTITKLEFAVTYPSAGNNTKKTIKFWKSNYTTINTSVAATSNRNSSGALGDYVTTVIAYNNSETITLDTSTNSDLFNSFVSYFSSGNNVLCIYNGETTLLNTQGYGTNACYSANYLQFKTCTLTVTYLDNYTVTYTDGSPASATKIEGTDLTINSTATPPAGYNFNGSWNTASDGSGTTYANGSTYSTNAALTLYPMYVKKTYSITYSKGNYTASNLPSSQVKTHGTSITLSTTIPTVSGSSTTGGYYVYLDPNGGTCEKEYIQATRTTAYVFSHWNTAADGSGTSYQSGSTYTTNASLNLYVQIKDGTVTQHSITLPTPARSGYTFLGWGTSDTATSNLLTGSYTPSSNITLYAIWKADGTVEIYNSTTKTFEIYQAIIYNSSTKKWDLVIPKIYNGSNWDDVYV